MRRLISIPVCLLLTLSMTLALPVLLPVAALINLFPATRGAVATLAFIIGYLWCETAGIVCAVYNSLKYRDRAARLLADFRVQCWWASKLKELAERFYRLTFTIHGEEALQGGPALVLPRHTSIADTVLPVTYFAKPFQHHLRYVLKKELLLDPCLDIYGNRLPNFFIARGGEDTQAAITGVRTLTQSLTPGEGVLLYTEGTRFSRAKHAAMLNKADLKPELEAQLRRWPDLLPPRLGGTLAMLQANPGRDLLFMAHVGFEGSSHFSNLINGSWNRAQVHIEFWRVPFAEIPTTEDSLREFLFTHWDRMQETVRKLQSL
ncbi:MAG: 1-acyl-sn-glycerol-3-phosphate acyltransferase [Pseudomonadales bacterium]